MIELYGMSSPNVFKISIMLEEVGLPWRIRYVNIVKGEQHTPEFLAIGPNNKVPVIVDPQGPDGTPFTVFESGAILIYLAEKTGKLLSQNLAERSIQMQWLMMQMGSVGPMFGQLMHFVRYEPPNTQYSRSRYTTEMRRILDVLERRLSTTPHLGGNDYSIVDIAVFPWMRVPLTYIPPFKGKDPAEGYAEYPAITHWLTAMFSRPAVQRGIAALETTVRPQDAKAIQSATPDDIDRLVGRGQFART